MLLTYSNDMQKAMGIRAEAAEKVDKSNTWYAHTLKINRRNCVVFMHTASHFCMVLWGLKAADYKKLDFKEHLANLLRAYYVDSDVICTYLYGCGDIAIAKNTDRSATSQLNHMVKVLKYLQNALDSSDLLQTAMSKKLNDRIFSMNGKYVYPRDLFFDQLKHTYQVPLYNARMLHLKITLDYPDYEISREILLPYDYTFYGLHRAIQCCFNWQNYHLYDFSVYDNRELLFRIVSEHEEEFDDMPVKRDIECSVYEVLAKYPDVQYIYDMGDYWEHRIELLEIVEEHENVIPTCLKVTGKAPPEDCGGIGGYQELLEQIADGDQDALVWVGSMKWDEQSVDGINKELKWRFR